MSLLSRLFERKAPQPDTVAFDGEQVTRTLPDGRTERVRWNELEEISIVTTADGPLTEDVFWMLRGTSGGCAVPGEARGINELLARLQQLPGFDNEAVVHAMGSTSNATFVCWKRGGTR